MCLNKRNPVYVMAPPFYKTGGTELCHQLVETINKMGREAHILYTYSPNGKYLNPAFEKYVEDYTVLDKTLYRKKDITVVIPETLSLEIEKFEHADIYLWWMSVDNYYHGQNWKLFYQEYGTLRFMKWLIFGSKFRKKYLKITKMDRVKLHLVQSEYARSFLVDNGIVNIKKLSDYINPAHFEFDAVGKNQIKKDIVLYNPSKGWQFTKKIIAANPDIEFVALKGMSNEQVVEHMLKAKVYIDFGPHPGKDRMPREAAIMGCCILTGRRGAANFAEDVDIPDEFKIEDKKENVPSISQKIHLLLSQYKIENLKYEKYRDKIKGERQAFDEEVKNIFLSV